MAIMSYVMNTTVSGYFNIGNSFVDIGTKGNEGSH